MDRPNHHTILFDIDTQVICDKSTIYTFNNQGDRATTQPLCLIEYRLYLTNKFSYDIKLERSRYKSWVTQK